MYLGLVFIVMIVTGSYMLITMQKTEIGKAKNQLQLYAEKVCEQVVESYDEADYQTGLEQFTRSNSSGSQIQGNIINSNGETVASTTVSHFPITKIRLCLWLFREVKALMIPERIPKAIPHGYAMLLRP